MGGTIRSLKVLHMSKSNNYGTTSILVFESALITMKRSLYKLQKLIAWSPLRVIYFRERNNEPGSMFCTDLKSHWPVHGRCR